MEHTTLYYRQGSSDKVYQASLESVDGGYVVHFAYGRRGATLQTGTVICSQRRCALGWPNWKLSTAWPRCASALVDGR
jgi:hypothetical protein